MAGRYSNAPNFIIFLKGHTGDPVSIDRKGRPPESIDRPALALGLMIQPFVLAGLVAVKQFRGQGLLARCLYSMPASKRGHRDVDPDPIPDPVRDAYGRLVTDLAVDIFGRGEAVVIAFSAEARQSLTVLQEDIEARLAPGAELDLIADWAGKYVGQVVRIAGLLHIAEHGTPGLGTPVSAATLAAAMRLGKYYLAHAVRAFDEIHTDEGTRDALYLLEVLSRQDKTTLSVRDLHRAARRFRTVAELGSVVDRLVTHGYLTRIERAVGKAGRPSAQIAVHPAVMKRRERGRNPEPGQ